MSIQSINILCQLHDKPTICSKHYLHMSSVIRMKVHNVCLETTSKGELLLTYGTNIQFDTRMRCNMINVVRAIRVSLSTLFTLVSGYILVDMSDMWIKSTFGDKRELAQSAGVSRAEVFALNVVHQLAPHRKSCSTVGAREYKITRRVSRHLLTRVLV